MTLSGKSSKRNGSSFWCGTSTPPCSTDEPSVDRENATSPSVPDHSTDFRRQSMDQHDSWAVYSHIVVPKPHNSTDRNWKVISEARANNGTLGLAQFRPVKLLGRGGTGSVHLAELKSSGYLFALKAMRKQDIAQQNKIHGTCVERKVLGMVDHPFLPTLYASFQTETHLFLVMEYCPGGEMGSLMRSQPGGRFSEAAARFFLAEIVLALEYLHCQGVVFRDLKPRNVLMGPSGHLVLADFDLSFLSQTTARLFYPEVQKSSLCTPNLFHSSEESNPRPIFVAKPSGSSISFVGSEEYISPEIVRRKEHSSGVDWWSLGVLFYEMLYGHTPFRGRVRKQTFTNVLTKQLVFPSSPAVSDEAKGLIQSLLVRDPSKRLGASYGASEVKSHSFFEGVQWPLLRNNKPPELQAPTPNRYSSSKFDSGDDAEWEF